MRVRCTVGLLVALAGSPAAAQQGRLDAVAVARAADSLAARPIWPGFEPRRHPVLIYDGRRTLLVRHPGHPAGFGPAGEGGARWYEGRHPLVAGNSYRSLEGIMLATLLPPSQPRSNAELGSTLIHELFHVHQQQRYKGWTANEAAIFELPTGEPAPLAARRLESATLAHALAAPTDPERACRARAALAVRRARFAAQPAEASRYERHL
ncbi:MAG TPA: hypothetical protein VFX50_02390, partial [Gemmatimonadales bacterium]|nr:hypothetical protein [Gemmatimonadales bacterium]